MVDAAILPTRRQADGQASITQTTATAGMAAGGGSVLLWIFACLQAGHLTTPSTEAIIFMGAAMAPIGHAIGRVVLHQLSRFSGPADQSGGPIA